MSTLLKDPQGEPLLVHCWYTRNWDTSYHTRRRYLAAIQFSRQSQGLPPLSSIDARGSSGEALASRDAGVLAAVSKGNGVSPLSIDLGNGTSRHSGIPR